MNCGAVVRFVGVVLFVSVAVAWSGELRKSYFQATKPGAWSAYLLTSGDASKSTFTYQRRPDDNGQIVIELTVKLLSGRGKDSASRNSYLMPRGFNLERDGLSFGKFIEKMSMSSSGMEMTVDDATLDQIRRAEKDFRGAVTFEATDTVDGRACDRYAYALRAGGPVPANEKGTLWLSDSVPFGIVRQTAEVSRPDGSKISSFEMRLQDSGVDQLSAKALPKPEQSTKAPVEPSTVALPEGYRAGRVGIEVMVAEGSSGRRLSLMLLNKTDAELTVTIRAGNTELRAGSPVNVLRFASADSITLQLPAKGRGGPVLVDQRGNRGINDGRCALSVYEGKLLFSGSVTIGPLSK
jgi:hypothetical protein